MVGWIAKTDMREIYRQCRPGLIFEGQQHFGVHAGVHLIFGKKAVLIAARPTGDEGNEDCAGQRACRSPPPAKGICSVSSSISDILKHNINHGLLWLLLINFDP
jgi:hypothetical protein